MTIETHNTNPKTTKPRRWFRFRLRTLLVMVTLLSFPLGWAGWELDQRRREKAAIAWVKKMGGQVIFGSPYSNRERSHWEKTKDKWFGERVRHVWLVGNDVNDLSPLSHLKTLENLRLESTQVSDLSPLAELKNLKSLGLIDPVSDQELSPLAKLRNLETLWLYHTLVREEQVLLREQVRELRLALPNCNIILDSPFE